MAVLSRKLRRLLLLVSRKTSHRSSFSSSCNSSSTWEMNDFYVSDDEDDFKLPKDVPQGCFAVYVGRERQRFVVGTSFLRNPLFRALLDKAADEYGFNHKGALVIPCEAVLFDHICWLLRNNDPSAAHLEMDELLTFYSS